MFMPYRGRASRWAKAWAATTRCATGSSTSTHQGLDIIPISKISWMPTSLREKFGASAAGQQCTNKGAPGTSWASMGLTGLPSQSYVLPELTSMWRLDLMGPSTSWASMGLSGLPSQSYVLPDLTSMWRLDLIRAFTRWALSWENLESHETVVTS